MAPKKEAKGGKSDKGGKAAPKATAGKSGGKQKKKKWSKGKVREKVNNLVLFDKGTYDRLLSEVPNYKLVTPALLSERLKINGSLAKRALRELVDKGLIRAVVKHRANAIYTRATAAALPEEAAAEKKADAKPARGAGKGGKPKADAAAAAAPAEAAKPLLLLPLLQLNPNKF